MMRAASWPNKRTGTVTHVHARTNTHSGRPFEGVPLIAVPSSWFRMLLLLQAQIWNYQKKILGLRLQKLEHRRAQ